MWRRARPCRYRGTFHDSIHAGALQIAAILTKTCLDGLADQVSLRNIKVGNLRLGCPNVLLKAKPWGRRRSVIVVPPVLCGLHSELGARAFYLLRPQTPQRLQENFIAQYERGRNTR